MQKTRHHLIDFFVVIIIIAITIMFPEGSVSSQDRPDLKSKALQSLSEELNVPQDRLETRGQEVKRLEYLGLDLYIFKILNLEALERGDDTIHFVALDSEGHRFNLYEMETQNIAAKKAKYGKLEPALYDHLQTIGPDETVKVDIWMMFEVEVRKSPTEDEMIAKGWDLIEEEDKVRRKRNEEGIKKFAEPIVAQIEAMGGKVLYIDGLSPTLEAELTRSQIEAIAQRDDVREILKLTGPEMYFPLLDISAKAVNAQSAWNSGYVGNNSRVAIARPKKETLLDVPVFVGEMTFNEGKNSGFTKDYIIEWRSGDLRITTDGSMSGTIETNYDGPSIPYSQFQDVLFVQVEGRYILPFHGDVENYPLSEVIPVVAHQSSKQSAAFILNEKFQPPPLVKGIDDGGMPLESVEICLTWVRIYRGNQHLYFHVFPGDADRYFNKPEIRFNQPPRVVSARFGYYSVLEDNQIGNSKNSDYYTWVRDNIRW